MTDLAPHYSAARLARAWLTARAASAKDDNPLYDRAIILEQHDGAGLFLAGVARDALVVTFCPDRRTEGEGELEWPPLELVADRIGCLSDRDGRAAGLLKYAAKLDEAVVSVDLDVKLAIDEAALPGLAASSIVLELDDATERTVLTSADASRITWRRLLASSLTAPVGYVDGITLNGRQAAIAAVMARENPAATLELTVGSDGLVLWIRAFEAYDGARLLVAHAAVAFGSLASALAPPSSAE